MNTANTQYKMVRLTSDVHALVRNMAIQDGRPMVHQIRILFEQELERRKRARQ